MNDAGGEGALGLYAAPANFADVHLVGENAINAGGRPAIAVFAGADAHIMQEASDASNAEPLEVPGKNLADNGRLGGLDGQGEPLFAGNSDSAISVRGAGGDIAALAYGLHAAGLNAAVDGFVFATRHEKRKFKKFYIKFIGRVVYF